MKKLPAGLTDNTLEVFLHEGQLLALSSGHTVPYFDLPDVLREPFQVELIKDKAAFDCLQADFKLFDADEIEHQFVACRYGALDSVPDFDGKKIKADAPGCDKISTCPGFNIVCKVPHGTNGTLSRSEFLVAKMVGEGKLDKEIADTLNIKVPTVRTHLARIREKLCVNNRIEIMRWTQHNGII